MLLEDQNVQAEIRSFTSEARFRSFTLEASLQKFHFRSFTSEVSLQKLHFRSTTSGAPFRSFTSEALLQEHASEASLQLLITIPIQGTCDMDMCPGKYICIDQLSNKGIYKDYVKKDIQCSFKTMNIDVLGKFHKGILS